MFKTHINVQSLYIWGAYDKLNDQTVLFQTIHSIPNTAFVHTQLNVKQLISNNLVLSLKKNS